MHSSRPKLQRATRFVIEQMEGRQLLTGELTSVANSLEPYLTVLHGAMSGISQVVNKLPVVNKPASQIAEITNTFNQIRTQLPETLRNIDNGSLTTNILKQAVAQVVGNTLGLLGDRNNNGIADAGDVTATDPTQPTFSIDIDLKRAYTIDIPAGEVSLGLDALPISFRAGTGATFTIGLEYLNFRFGRNAGGFFFDSSPFRELKFQLAGKLPQQMDGILGMFNATVTNNRPTTQGNDFTATLSADVQPTGIGSINLAGMTNIDLNIRASAGANDWMPSVRSDLVLAWPFNTDPTAGRALFGVPTLAFNNVGITIGSFFGSIISPLAQTVDKVVAPLQPVFDLLDVPIPGISDVSRRFGGPDMTMARLVAFQQSFPDTWPKLNDGLVNLIEFTQRLRDFTNTVESLATDAGDAYINLGNFPITGPAGGSLLVDTLGGVLGSSLGSVFGDFSSLIAGGANLSPEVIFQRIRDVPVVGDALANALTRFTANQVADGPEFQYPIVTDTKNQIVNMLLGVGDAEFVTGTIRFQQPLIDKDISIPIASPLVITVKANVSPDVLIRFGYDSRGLRRVVEKVVAGGNVAAALSEHLDDGLFIRGDSRLKLNASLAAGPGVDLVFASASITANLSASPAINVVMDVPQGTDKVRPLGSSSDGDTLIGNNLFLVSGRLTAGASLNWKIGTGPLAYSDSLTIAEKELFSFNNYPDGAIASPFTAAQPPVLMAFEGPAISGSYYLQMGSQARRNARGIAPNDIDEQFTVRQFQNAVGQSVLEVSAYGLTQQFPAFGTHEIIIDGDSGNDSVFIDASVTRPIVFNGGDGNDAFNYAGTGPVTVNAGSGDDKIRLDLRQPRNPLNGGTLSIAGGTGNDQVHVIPPAASPNALTLNISGGDQDDQIQVDSLPPSNMTINAYGDSGNDALTAMVPQGNASIPWVTPGTVTFDGGGQIGDGFYWRTVTPFVAGPGGTQLQQPTHDLLFISDDGVVRAATAYQVTIHAVGVGRYSILQGSGNDQTIVLASGKRIDVAGGDGHDYFSSGGSGNEFHVFGGNGNDTFNHWGGTPFSNVNFNELHGNAGIDELEFDVSQASTSSWTMSPGQMTLGVNGGAPADITVNGWEAVKYTGTAGQDIVVVQSGVRPSFALDLRGGDDIVILQTVQNAPQDFVFNAIRLNGGAGNDLLWTIADPDQDQFIVDTDSIFAEEGGELGGNPTNQLVVSDYRNFEQHTIDTGDLNDTVSIDAGGDPALVFDLSTGGGNDSIHFSSFDLGTASATLEGAAGNDAITFDDSTRVGGAQYTLRSSGLSVGPRALATPGIESVTLVTGPGNDNIELRDLLITTNSINVQSGSGDDLLRNGLYSGQGDLAASIASGTSVVWNGGDGADLFEIDNSAQPFTWSYTLSPTAFSSARAGLLGYTLSVPLTQVEGYRLTSGSGNDFITVPATEPDDFISLSGGAGNDQYRTYNLGTNRTDEIRSVIRINDSSGNDTLVASNSGQEDTGELGDWLHITEGVLSHASFDRFFAPGGRVLHSGMDLLNVTMSQAGDYAIIQPSASYAISIDGYSPTLPPTGGDLMDFALAGVSAPVFGGSPSAQTLTSASHLPVSFQDFEVTISGDESPAIAEPAGVIFDAPAFYLNPRFTVEMDPYAFSSGDAFTITNLTTGSTVYPGHINAVPDGVNGFFITFPGLPMGLPPDGRYRMTINGDHARSSHYNPLGNDYTQEFTILRGDTNNDAAVNLDDFTALAASFGQTGRVFSEGDFNYDGAVNLDDFTILASQFGATLPASRDAAPRGSAMALSQLASPTSELFATKRLFEAVFADGSTLL